MRFKVLYIYIIILSAPAISIYCQYPGDEEKLQQLFNDIVATRNNEERRALNDSIINITDSYVKSENIFNHRFENLRFLGQILSPDAKVKIITWNLLLTDGTNEYHSYIIWKKRRKSEEKVYKLTAENMDDPPSTDLIYNAQNWYGALYYAVQPFRINGDTYYATLGLDYTSLKVTTKIIDVFSVTDDGEIIFGKNCFIKDGKELYRDNLIYSADGVVTLRFENKKTIIFDHLVPVGDGRNNSTGLYVPEFSFDAYILKRGRWVFHENYEPKIRK